jgi:hypothetical protein
MQKFRKADREKIMSDWRACVSSMRLFKSMMLMKRNGPILVGLWLKENRGNTYYTVNPFVHNLLTPTGFVSLKLMYPLKNKRNTYQDDFTLKSHDREFPDACKRLHKQTLFPLTEELTLGQIISAFDLSIERKLTLDSHDHLYEDILRLLTWCGQTVEATKRLPKYIQIMSEWDERLFDRDGGRNTVFDRFYEILEKPKQLEDVYEQQLELLKLKKIPDYGFSCL